MAAPGENLRINSDRLWDSIMGLSKAEQRERINRTLDTYKEEGLLNRGEELAPYWEDALHSLKGEPHAAARLYRACAGLRCRLAFDG